MKKWDWKKQLSGSLLYDKYNCIGFSINEKGRYKTFSTHDIPEEARKGLASLFQLNAGNFDDWAELEKTDIYQGHYRFWIKIEKIWYQAKKENWDWDKDFFTGGQETVKYECSGWKCSKEILRKIKNNTISINDIPVSGKEKLAKEIGLDPREISSWGSNFRTDINSDGLHVTINVPNVWITADILLFQFIINKPQTWLSGIFAPIGGSMGMGYFSVAKAVNHKIVNCRTFPETIEALSRYKKKIIGFAFFAHGNKDGVIVPVPSPSPNTINWQTELLDAVRCNGYKLANIYLMQCYSGFEGNTSTKSILDILKLKNDPYVRQITEIEEENYNVIHEKIHLIVISKINNAIKNCKYISFTTPIKSYFIKLEKKGKIGIYCQVGIRVTWATGWNQLGINVHTYQGMNILLFDTGWTENLYRKIKHKL